jgi:hypothetical protein
MSWVRQLTRTFGLCAVAVLSSAAVAGAAPPAHGHLVKVPKPRLHTNQSTNWFGYNQGTLEQGGKQFNAITANWTVPTASSHTRGKNEYSSTWIGIGGGCVDAGCLVTDNTLIQTGTEQDVSSSGRASYSAWWEVIPLPSISINMTVAAGDKMFASIAEAVPGSNVWTIVLKDLTRKETFTQTVPYSSTHATAEWISETPLILDISGSGFAALPNLAKTPFDSGTTNGKTAGLNATEEMQLIDGNGRVIATPSAPDSDKDGFANCSWATSCAAPAS